MLCDGFNNLHVSGIKPYLYLKISFYAGFYELKYHKSIRDTTMPINAKATL